MARRAALEIRPDASLNFVAERGNADELWISVEQGTHNGRMLDERLFGAARNPDAIVPSIEQFDYYSGGGIGITFLGMGEADADRNVNVSHPGGNLIGPGGFIEIAQNAKKVVFCGSFDAQGTRLAWSEGRLVVEHPGKVRKFVQQVERVTFSASYARRIGQEVLYITERAVFRLAEKGLALIEAAPGMEIERDILPYMGFRPEIGTVRKMPPEVFA